MEEISKKVESYFKDFQSKVLNELKSSYKTYSTKEISEDNLMDLTKLRKKIMSPIVGYLELGLRILAKLPKPQQQPVEDKKDSLLLDPLSSSIRNSESFKFLTNFKTEHKISDEDKFSNLLEIQFQNNKTEEINIGFTDKEKADGLGIWINGKEVYFGEWEYGLKSRFGAYVSPQGNIFKGEFKKGVPVVGHWIFPDRKEFYGKIELFPESKKIEYMIGKKKEDKDGKFVNCLYAKNQKTMLRDLKYDQNLDINLLRGDFENPKKTSLIWLNNIKFEGYWDKFYPILGEFIIPDMEKPEIKHKISVYGSRIALVPIKQIPLQNPKMIIERAEIKLKFLTDEVYDGQINHTFEINGWGAFIDSEGKKKAGLYVSGRPTFEIDVEHKETMEFFEKYKARYFDDSEKFMEEHPEVKELPMIHLKNKVPLMVKSKTIGYQGHWKNNDFKDGDATVKSGGRVFKCTVNDGGLLGVYGFTLAELIENAGENQILDLNFVSGDKYKGSYIITDNVITGYGKATKANGDVYDGIWNSNVFALNKDILKDENFDMKKLEKGNHKLEFKDGAILDAEFKKFKITKGKFFKKSGDEGIEIDAKTIADHYDLTGDKKNFKFTPKTIEGISMYINGKATESPGNGKGILQEIYKNKDFNELKLMKENNIIDKDLKFLGKVYSDKTPLDERKITLNDVFSKKSENKKEEITKGKSEVDIKKKENSLTKINFEKIFIYDEKESTRNLNPQSTKEDFEASAFFNSDEFFKKIKSRKIGSLKDEEKTKIIEENKKFFEDLEASKSPEEKKKKKLYYQISESGMLRSHSDLFSFEDYKIRKNHQLNRLIFDTPIRYSLFELNKLNGICEVNEKSLKFFNGDVYKFDNMERSYHRSLGSLHKYGQEKPKRYYWNLFFAETQFTKFDDEYYEKELKDFFNWKCVSDFSICKIKYIDGKEVDGMFYEGKLAGNVKIKTEENEIETVMIYNKSQKVKNGPDVIFTSVYQLRDDLSVIYSIAEIIFDLLNPKNFLDDQKRIQQGYSDKKIILQDSILQLEANNDFKVTVNKVTQPKFTDLLANTNESNGVVVNSKKKNLILNFSNGDVYIGEGSGRSKLNSEGRYEWLEGFTYKGEFYINTPYGEGTYSNCLGVKREGYFYRGYLLSQPFGLDKLKESLKEKFTVYKKSHVTRLIEDDLRFLTDPDLILGCQMFKNKIKFRSIFDEMEKWEKIFSRDLECIKDGELDCKDIWSDVTRSKVQIALIKEYLEENQEEKKMRNSEKKLGLEDEKESARLEKKNSKSGEGKKVQDKFGWIKKMKIKKLSDFQVQEIIEFVKDQNYEGINLVYKKFLSKNKVFQFLKLEDKQMRNLLMISAHLGHRQLVVDILAALKRCIPVEKLTEAQIQKYLEMKDFEGNNLIDLAVIKGFNVKDDHTFANKEPEESWEESIFGEKKPIETQKKGNTIFNSSIKMIKNNERELFTSEFLTFSKLFKSMKKSEEEDEADFETDKIIFLTKRSVILFIILKFCGKCNDINLLKQKDYDEKKNNPLHFSLFKGDFHTTMILLEHKIMMLLWRNGDNELPPQVIRWAGENYFKSKAIFSSILREFTRNFNLKVIDHLLVQDEGVLSHQKKKLHFEFNEKIDENSEKEKAKLMKKVISEHFSFDKEKVFLYSNNYILLSDELCKQYLSLMKDKSRYRHLKKKHKVLKNYTFVKNSELESLQKNFLDYYQGNFSGYHPPDVEKFYRESIQEILAWYVFVYGDAEIEPRIYSMMNIDPFETILDGRNIIHFMCENNSYSLFKEFLEFFYENCHTRPFDQTRDDYKAWDDETLDQEKFQKLKKNLMIKTKENGQTPAHICVMNQNFECLELLVEYDIDLDAINLRGRTVKELLEPFYPYNLDSRTSVSPEDISAQIIEFFKQDIINGCKQHSLKYKYLKKNRNQMFSDLMTKSKYMLSGELKKVRGVIYEDSLQSFEKFIDCGRKISFYDQYLMKASEINEIEDFPSKMKICRDFLNIFENPDQRKMGLLNSSIKSSDLKTMTLSLINLILGGQTDFIDQKKILFYLFNPNILKRIKKFKPTEHERITKKDLHNTLQTVDLSNPLPDNLKKKFSMDQQFCIQVQIKEGEKIQDNVVLDQIDNIKKKYAEYGGGLRIDLIKGYKGDSSNSIFGRSSNKQSWFILIKICDDLLTHIATRDQMSTYNFTLDIKTLFYENDINSDQLEPLRHYQKMDILMKLLQEEFDINRYKKKGLVVRFFPVHDYSKMSLIKRIWSESKWDIHFKDTFSSKTKKSTLTVLSMITFYHGIQQGFYFGFLAVYNNSLFLLALVGIIGIILQYFMTLEEKELVMGMSLLVGVWSTIFVNMWKRREKELAYSFDAFEEENIKTVREDYKGEPIIDPGLLDISKKKTENNCKKIVFTSILFTFGFLISLGIYYMVIDLNARITENENFSDIFKTVLTFAVGTLNGTLNFILSIIYGYFVDLLVIWENHIYAEEMRKSSIMKQQSFKLATSVFTLIVQSIFQSDSEFDYNNYTLQIFSNLVTSAALNYGMSIGLPFFTYLSSRYYYYSHIFLCKWCCCKKKRGKLDESRENIIYKMLGDNKTKHTFMRYCVKGEKLSDEVQDKFEKKRRIFEEENEFYNKTPMKKNQIISKEESLNYEKETLLNKSNSFKNNNKDEGNLEKTFEKIEKVDPVSNYKGHCKSLGQNRRRNISLRLKEEFLKYVLGREKIIETSYMLDIGSLENDFYSSLLTQFTFICFFSQFMISAGLVSYLINIIIIYLTIRAYTENTRRPISRRVSGIGVWTNLFDVVGYLGIIYNTIITVKLNGGLKNFLGDDIIKTEIKDVEYIYRVQFGLLVFKFILSILIPTLPTWIKKRNNREKLTKTRVSKELSSTLSRLNEEMNRNVDKNIFEDDESKNLKYFFKNDDEICEYVRLPKEYLEDKLKVDELIGKNDMRFKIKKSKQELL